MNQVEFETAARHEGYDEVAVKDLAERPTNALHTHPFDARALILDGEITITTDATPTRYLPGEVFSVTTGCVHQETIPAGGVRILSALRHHSELARS